MITRLLFYRSTASLLAGRCCSTCGPRDFILVFEFKYVSRGFRTVPAVINNFQDTTVKNYNSKGRRKARMLLFPHAYKSSSFPLIHTLSLSLSNTRHTHTHTILSQRHGPEKGLRHRLLWRTTAASSWHSNGPGKPFPQEGGCQRGEVSPRSAKDEEKKKE